jgi:hypothetical protein
MISAYFTRQGFVSVEPLPETERFNSSFFSKAILLNTVQFASIFRPKMQAQGSWMHIDHATPPNSALSLKKTEELGFTRLIRPLISMISFYSAD